MKSLTSAAILLLLAGCAPASPYIRAYHGVVQPSEEVGLLRVTAGPQLQVRAIDGERYTSMPREGDAYIAFRPGEHTVTLAVGPSAADNTVKFTIQRMRNYVLSATPTGAQVIDVTDKPDQWCLSCYLEPSRASGTIADMPWQRR